MIDVGLFVIKIWVLSGHKELIGLVLVLWLLLFSYCFPKNRAFGTLPACHNGSAS